MNLRKGCAPHVVIFTFGIIATLAACSEYLFMLASTFTLDNLPGGAQYTEAGDLMERRMNHTIDTLLSAMREEMPNKGELASLVQRVAAVEKQLQNPEQVNSEHKTALNDKEFAMLSDRILSIEQSVNALKSAPTLPDETFSSNLSSYGTNNEEFCVTWDVNTDEWWTHHPDWVVSHENETHYCFAPMENPEKAMFFRDLYDIQFHGNCSDQILKQRYA